MGYMGLHIHTVVICIYMSAPLAYESEASGRLANQYTSLLCITALIAFMVINELNDPWA